ncbi:hypothetical protein C8F04DRAFT_1399341 [Mycena alexandri]|uniref:Uncharacterized protein n=1 Tax=Mycena alexandri TaxID=1745969 RepID=A0AAD6WWH0_9AGAR|nr:hypothetical protein C8F04DRAFT_1399341 [Mycena alexandri]
MDQPSWNDTLRASLGACLPCLVSARTESEDEQDGYGTRLPGPHDASFGVRRARADELEGLLRSSSSSSADDGWGTGGDAAADADAISLHSHLGPRGRRKPPPRTPRRIALWGFDLFGRAGKGEGVRLEGEDGVLAGARDDPATPPPPTRTSRRGGADQATSALLARAALEPSPHALTGDVTEADVERRARRKARKEMRRMARLVAAEPDSAPSPAYDEPPAGHPSGLPHLFLPPSPGPGPHIPHPQDDSDEADLDGGVYARLAPRPKGGSQSNSRSSGRSSGSGGPPYSPTVAGYVRGVQGAAAAVGVAPKATKSKRSRGSKSKSSATSSTLASPPPTATAFPAHAQEGIRDSGVYDGKAQAGEEFGDFAHAPVGGFEQQEEFDGTPGGFDAFPSAFDAEDVEVEVEEREVEVEVRREAMPSAGLSRGRW